MDNNINQQKVLYKHITVEGTSYEVGKILGQLIITKAGSFRNIATNFHEKDKGVRRYINNAIEYFDRYCPGINDEIRGVADTLGVSVEEIIYYINTYKSKGGCSQMAVLPGITANGHIYADREDYYAVLPNDNKKPLWKKLPPGANDCSEFEIV
ncbi:putative choloylglycine hydrolase [Clostridium punense]|uniref:Choloylglycine hydrolase n=1 Tax=Clostridium punense TaxID=1054297 RepID=A0ABS4K9E5_9CLOT|nr:MULTISPECIES: hypothetical protein [Clostridium]EQB89100.1 hypothetical protein M918_22015 [Clostridium sp. BL8]MBP2024401.1 putative choloylglycine hydrolase [Clostridium punense]